MSDQLNFNKLKYINTSITPAKLKQNLSLINHYKGYEEVEVSIIIFIANIFNQFITYSKIKSRAVMFV